MDVLHGIEPFIRVQRAENKDEDCNVHTFWFQILGQPVR